MSGNMTPINENSSILIYGDSIMAKNAIATDIYRVANNIQTYVDGWFLRKNLLRNNGKFLRPRWFCEATSGRTIGTCVTALNTELVAGRYTHMIGLLDINDAKNGVTIAQSRTDCSSLLALAFARGILGGLWAGGCVVGEKWPTGANGAVDTAIDALDSGTPPNIATLVNAQSGWQYVSTRQKIYTPYEPVNNLANVTMDGGTSPDALGIHFNPSFASLFVNTCVIPFLNLQSIY